jgi:hypothetical protein
MDDKKVAWILDELSMEHIDGITPEQITTLLNGDPTDLDDAEVDLIFELDDEWHLKHNL